MLRYAQRAYDLDPRDIDNQVTLGQAQIIAARRNVNTAENLKAGVRTIRRARAKNGDVVMPEAYVLPDFSKVSKTTKMLERAVAAREAGDYDKAEAIAMKALDVDPNAARAHGFVRDLRMLRQFQTGAELSDREALPVWLRTRSQQRELARRARDRGIERLVPQFHELNLQHQAQVAHATLPMAGIWNRMTRLGETANLVPSSASLLDYHDDIKLRERSFDHRYYYGIRGTGGLHSYTGEELLDIAAYGELDTFGHEFGHQVEWVLPPKDLKRLQRLYERHKDNAIDDYAASNVHEYLAVGYEAFTSDQKSPLATKYARHTREELKQRDPQLYALLKEWTQRRSWPVYRAP
jgi:hypothetical protein